MQKYQNSLTNSSGQSIVGARVLVTTLAGATAVIYSDNGVTRRANPIVVDGAQGEFSFYAANGRYTLTTTGANIAPDITSDIILYDPSDGLPDYSAPGGAALVGFAATGGIVATTVQAAIEEVVADLAASSGAGLVGFIQSGTGAVARTMQDKGLELVSLWDFGAVGGGTTSDVDAVQLYLNACASNTGMCFIGGGTFLIDDTVMIPANLDLHLSSNTVFLGVKNNKPMFLNGTYGATYTARNANSNITITGGVFDFAGNNTSGYNSGLAFGQASNISLRGCLFRNMDTFHFIEFNAIDGATVDHCVFENMFDPSGTRYYSEAIQIDAALHPDVFPYFSAASMDGTVTKNVRVTGCKFTDCLTAIGSHTYSVYGTGLLTEMNTDINISDCVIESCGWDAIRTEGWHRFNIKNVTINAAGNNGIRVNDSLNFELSAIVMGSIVGNGIYIYRNTYETQSGVVTNISMRTGLDVVRLDGVALDGPSNITLMGINGYDVRNGLQMGGCDNVVVDGILAEACSDYGIKCDITKNVSNRVTISDFTIRNTTLDNMLLYLASSDVGVGVCSLPAASKNNITTYGCNSLAIHDIFFNGASSQDQVLVSGTATSASTAVVLRDLHFRGTAVNGINVAAGATNNILIGNVVRATYSGSKVVNSGTGTTQFGNDPLAGSSTYDPASLVDGAGATTTVTVTGALLGDHAIATFSLDLQGILLTAWVSAANTVSVRFQNETGGTIDLASGTIKAVVTKM